MLYTKTYTREELEQLFATSRMDAIKRKLSSDGYIYTTSGRGKDFTLTITECTKPFKVFCKEELGFPPQTDFDKLKDFLKRLFEDERFSKLPFSAMEDEIGVSSQTVSKWIKHLVQQNIIILSNAEFDYYITRVVPKCRKAEIMEITEQQYKDAWKAYWEDRNDGYFLSINRMYYVNQGVAHKRGKLQENAFEKDKLERLKELLKGEEE